MIEQVRSGSYRFNNSVVGLRLIPVAGVTCVVKIVLGRCARQEPGGRTAGVGPGDIGGAKAARGERSEAEYCRGARLRII